MRDAEVEAVGNGAIFKVCQPTFELRYGTNQPITAK